MLLPTAVGLVEQNLSQLESAKAAGEWRPGLSRGNQFDLTFIDRILVKAVIFVAVAVASDAEAAIVGVLSAEVVHTGRGNAVREEGAVIQFHHDFFKWWVALTRRRDVIHRRSPADGSIVRGLSGRIEADEVVRAAAGVDALPAAA